MIVPLEVNEDRTLLLMSRVIQWTSYLQSYGIPTILREYPNCIRFEGEYYAIMSESFYFYSEPVDVLDDPNNMVVHANPIEASPTILMPDPNPISKSAAAPSSPPRLFKKLKT